MDGVIPKHNHSLDIIRRPGLCPACDLLHDVACTQLIKINDATH